MEGWFFLTAALLISSGTAKFMHPNPTAGALRAARLRAAAPVVRILALTEIGTGVGALWWGGYPAGLVLALLYAGFAVFVILARVRHWPISSCGCFGRPDTPPSLFHVALNVAAVVGGISVAIDRSPGLAVVAADQPLLGLPYLGFLATGTYLLYLILTDLPVLGEKAR